MTHPFIQWVLPRFPSQQAAGGGMCFSLVGHGPSCCRQQHNVVKFPGFYCLLHDAAVRPLLYAFPHL
jgi:hypothetical protein